MGNRGFSLIESVLSVILAGTLIVLIVFMMRHITDTSSFVQGSARFVQTQVVMERLVERDMIFCEEDIILVDKHLIMGDRIYDFNSGITINGRDLNAPSDIETEIGINESTLSITIKSRHGEIQSLYNREALVREGISLDADEN